MSLRAIAMMFALGAICLTLLDSIHVHTHTLAYAHPVAFGSAWWVALLMGCATAGGGLGYVLGWSRLGGPTAIPTRAALARGALVFAAVYAGSGLLPVSAVMKLILITLGAAVIFFDLDGTWRGATLILIGAVAGTIAEAINPGFHYFEPDAFGVPMWLPALYACATPVVGQLARRLAHEHSPAAEVVGGRLGLARAPD